MAAMLRCPSCNEIITADSTQCKYCSLPLDRDVLKTEVAKFEEVSNAVSQANTIQAFNAGLIIVGILCIYLLVAGMSALERVYLHAFPYAGLVWAVSWFVRFGRLQSKDPDFDPARAGIKRSLLMWSAGAVFYTCCVIWVLASWLRQSNDAFRN
jgi:hypothetical protein